MAENNAQTGPRPLALIPAQGSRPPLIVNFSKKYILIRQNVATLQSTVRRPLCVINQNDQNTVPLGTADRRPLTLVNPITTSNNNNPVNVKTDVIVKSPFLIQAKRSGGKNPIDDHLAHAQEIPNKPLSSRAQGFASGSILKQTTQPSKVIAGLPVKKTLSLSLAKSSARKNPIDANIAHAREVSNKLLNSHAQGFDTGSIPKQTVPSEVITEPLVKKSLLLSQAKSSGGKNLIDDHSDHALEVPKKLFSSCAQGFDTGSIPKQTVPSEVITEPLVKKSLLLSQAKSSGGKNLIDDHSDHALEVPKKLFSSCAQGFDTGSIPKQTVPSEVVTAPVCNTENFEKIVVPADVVTLQSSSADESDLSDDAFQPRIRKKKVVSNAPANQTGDTSDSKRTSRKIAGCRKTPEELASIVQMAREKSLSDPSFSKIHENMPSFMADYVITEATLSPNPHTEGDGDFWTAKIRINISDKAGVYEWLSNYENVSACDFRVSFSKKENSKRLVFKKEYHCHHDTKPRTSSRPQKTVKSKNWKSKNTSCPSIIRFTIKQKSMDWSSDYLLKEYPCEIFIRHHHNHPIKCADAQRLRRPNAEVKEKFVKLFAQGHSPISAIETHKFDLMMEHGENYIYVAADGTKCPTNFWVYKLFKKVCVSHYGPQSGEGLIASLRAFALKYNDEMKSECIKVEVQNDRDLIVAICTPMMKRTRVATLIR